MSIPAPSYETMGHRIGNIVAAPTESPRIGQREFARVPAGGFFPGLIRLHYLPGQLNPTTALELFTEWSNQGASTAFSYTTTWGDSYTVRFTTDDLDFDVSSLIAFGCTVDLSTEIITDA